LKRRQGLLPFDFVSKAKCFCIYGHFGQKWRIESGRRTMQILSAKDAKYNFGKLIDMARAEPVTVEKHGRAVVVVLAVEEYERLKAIEVGQNG
jgi:prevent-host-death family protein